MVRLGDYPPVCDDGAGVVLLLFAQQLADVWVICCILYVVLHPWLNEIGEVAVLCGDSQGELKLSCGGVAGCVLLCCQWRIIFLAVML